MSTVPTESVLYDVNDFKVTKLTADTGVAPTYDSTLVDVPGIASVSMSPNIVTGELKGDAKVIAKRGTTDRFTYSATYGKLSLDALAVFLGGTVSQETTPAAAARWTIGGVNSLPYFKAMFQILQGDVADTHITAYKSQITGGTLLDQSTDNFGQPTIDFEAIPAASDDTLFVSIDFLGAVAPLA